MHDIARLNSGACGKEEPREAEKDLSVLLRRVTLLYLFHQIVFKSGFFLLVQHIQVRSQAGGTVPFQNILIRVQLVIVGR